MQNRFIDRLRRHTAAITLPILLATAVLSGGWVQLPDKPVWPDGTVTLTLELGTSPTYSDSSNPDSSVAVAAQTWNPNMARVQLKTVDSSATATEKNGVNDVSFSNSVYGQSFGTEALAVTLVYHSTGVIDETDVIFNTAYKWDSFRGPLNYTSKTSPVDIRRVALHEFGHVLGLDHPDQAGQNVSSIMNSVIGNLDTLAQDDKDGIRALYGSTPSNPGILPTITSQPVSTTVDYGTSAVFAVSASSWAPKTYQWTKDGTPIAGATQSTLDIPQARSSDAGTYDVTVSNQDGSVTSKKATLSVNPPIPPQISIRNSDRTVEYNTIVNFSTTYSGSQPMLFQWLKDGKPLQGETNSTLRFSNATDTDSGDYSVTATNDGGSFTSPTVHLTVYPPRPAQDVVATGDTSVAYYGYTHFHVSVGGGTGPFTYQWKHNDTDITGQTDNYLRILHALPADAGSYSVVVSDPYGQTESNIINLVVQSPIPPTTDTLGSGFSMESGHSASIPIMVGGSPPFKGKLERNGVSIGTSTSTNNSLDFDLFGSPDYEGVYRWLITNAGGSVLSGRFLVRLVTPGYPYYNGLSESSIESMWYNENLFFPTILSDDAGSGFIITPAGRRVEISEQYSASENSIGAFQTIRKEPIGNINFAPSYLSVKSPSPAAMISQISNGRHALILPSGQLCITDPGSMTIKSYNSVNQDWTTSASFAITPTALCSDSDHVYVAAGGSIYAYSTDFKQSSLLATLSGTVFALKATNTYLYALCTAPAGSTSTDLRGIVILDKQGNVVATSQESAIRTPWISFVRGSYQGNTVYAEKMMDTPSWPQIFTLSVDAGTKSVVETDTNLLQSDSPSAPAYLSSDGSLLYLPNGIVKHTDPTITDSDTIGAGGYFDLTLLSDGRPVILQGDKLTVLDKSNTPTLSLGLASAGSRILSEANDTIDVLFGLYGDALPTVSKFNLSQFSGIGSLSTAGEPENMTAPPISCAVGGDGIVYLLGNNGRSLFRWSTDHHGFLSTLGLPDTFDTVGTVGGSIYLAAADGNFAALDAGGSALSFKHPLRSTGSAVHFANGLVLVQDTSSNYTVTTSGTVQNDAIPGDIGPWDPVTGQIYFRPRVVFTGQSTINVTELGSAGSPSTSRRWATSSDFPRNEHLWVAPKLNFLIGSSGVIVDATTGAKIADLKFLIRDVAYTDTRFATLRIDTAGSRVDTWDSNANHLKSAVITGLPFRVFALPNGDWIAITLVNNLPVFNLFDSDLNPLSTSQVPSVGPITSASPPANQIIDPGQTTVFSATLDGSEPYTYQWYRDGNAIPFANSPSLAILNATSADSGNYTVKVSAYGVSSTFQEGQLFVGFPDSKLINVSTRGEVGTGNNVLIAGFVVNGSSPKQYLIRAVGPSLDAKILPDRIDNPEIELHDSTSIVATDTDWTGEANATDISSISDQVGAQPLNSGSHDAAILTTLKPGAYTAVVKGVNSTSGIGLVEVYDVTPSDTDTTHPKLVNISTRGYVGTGDQVLIAGFVIRGNGPKKVLIRAVGPTLSTMSVTSPLLDPELDLYDRQTKIAENDNWSTDSLKASAIDAANYQTGAFTLPYGSKDAALLTTLLPGHPYTVIVRGVNGATGVALVEVYEVPSN